RALKVLAFILCLVPVGILAWGFFGAHPTDMSSWGQGLGANPLEVITHSTGDWTMRFLLITLAITPLRKITKLNWLIRFRRMLGLFAFFYGTLHLFTYLWFDKDFVLADILADVGKRRFITVGFLGFVLMIPLAVTSTAWAIRKMGGKRWQALHRLIYFSAIAGVIHYIWLVKSDLTKPLQYGVILGVLLLYRVVVWVWPKGPRKVIARTAEA
ncbi:MAG TPA: protein-methionine-sulfoxide reductase heme-binding subunit MsrQ, partial [Terriglobales bacterium]|nr:protein-methionine-sulfoxide reductase heme-binding subunit MsrQ [Terriglobales bacterium]